MSNFMNMEGVGCVSVKYDCETKEFELPEPLIIRYQGSHGEYYQYNGVNYDIHFPVNWACQKPEGLSEEDLEEFGHEKCNNCMDYGYYNGVVIGYCANCAGLMNYTRGNGMISVGEELTSEYPTEVTLPFEILDVNSMWNVYMQTAELDNIGDSVLAEEQAERMEQFKKMAEERIRKERIQYWEGYWKMREENDEMDIGQDNFVSVSSANASPFHSVVSEEIPETESQPIQTLTLEYPYSEQDYSYLDSIV